MRTIARDSDDQTLCLAIIPFDLLAGIRTTHPITGHITLHGHETAALLPRRGPGRPEWIGSPARSSAGPSAARIDSSEGEGIAGAPRPVPDRVDDSRELPPGDLIVRDRDVEDLARPPRRATRRAVAVTATAMLAPPVIAAIAGGLGLAVTVGMLSIFLALVGLAAIAYGQEHWRRPRPRPRPLPRARARLRLRS